MKFFVCTLILFFTSVQANAFTVGPITVGPNDVYQQSSASPFHVGSLHMEGGQIVGREDGRRTWFINGPFMISQGVEDAGLLLDNSPTSTEISGGVFNDRLEIDRVGDTGFLKISGGEFNKEVRVSRYQGDVILAGGNFRNGISLFPSFTDGALPTLNFIGTDWTLNGQSLSFQNSITNITGRLGVLSGRLADGNDFSVFLEARNQPHLVTVQVPEPSALALVSMVVAGLFCSHHRPSRQ